jgi:hypothetical protein
MANPRTGKFAPVTLGHMRSQGCRDLLVYCNSGRCNHRATMLPGHLSDDTPIKSLDYVIVCERCGHSARGWCQIGQRRRHLELRVSRDTSAQIATGDKQLVSARRTFPATSTD